MDVKSIYIASAIHNVGLFLLIGFCVWYLNSAVPLIGLAMIKTVRSKAEDTIL